MIERIARDHGIETRRTTGGRLELLEVSVLATGWTVEQWRDATDWTAAQLWIWLGY